jgi:heat shock protein HslJ
MGSLSRFRKTVALATLAVALATPVAWAQEFPFGLEMTLDAERQPGSKRLPTLEIGDDGEVLVELWCKGGRARFSIAGNSVVFVPGAMQQRTCPPAMAQADDALLAALAEATSWSRQGDLISFVGAQTLRFRLNTN